MRSFILVSLLVGAASVSGCASKQSPAPNAAEETAERAATQTSPRETDTPKASNLSVLETLAVNPLRSEANRARNDARHPAETLDFFGIEPDMTVVEIGPGGGWYAEIIAPFVLHAGTYIAGLDDPEGPRAHYRAGWERLVAAQPEIYGQAKTSVLNPPAHELADEDSVDLVVSFRHAHGWINNGTDAAILAEIFRVLKPGGTFGIVQHRAQAGAVHIESAKHGYVPQAWLVSAAEAAGFELVESSEINANPKDSADHPDGVWSLPPTLKGGEETEAQYRAIGESDRMTLKFRKPAQ